MSSKVSTSEIPALPARPTLSPRGLMARLQVPRSRFAIVQSLVGIALSYELLFGNETVVARWVAELIVVGLLSTILAVVVVPRRAVERPWFVMTLVAADTILTTVTVYVSGNAHEEFYLAYFLLMLVTTASRTLGQMLSLSLIVSLGYAVLSAETWWTGGDLSAGRWLGVPVLLLMGVFYGLTLDELGMERRRGDGLSHRLAELRLEEEHLLLTRDRLLHETATLKSALAQQSQRRTSAPVARAAASGRPSASGGDGARDAMERLAGHVAAMLQDVAGRIGRETGTLTATLNRDHLLHKHVEQLMLAGDQTATLSTQLRLLAGAEPVQREACSMNALLRDLEPLIREMLPESVDLTLDLCAADGSLETEVGLLEDIVLRLVMHARDAMPAGGQLVVATREVEQATHSAEGSSPRAWQLIVRDSGAGMNAETQAGLLEPFFSTKPRGGAWGMGIAAVQTTVVRTGGTLAVSSRTGRGTDVTATWPCAGGAAPQAGGLRPDPALCANEGETLLLVEEDEGERKGLVAVLRRAGYRVIEAQSGVQAMLVARQFPGTIHLVITGLVMPEMAGTELAERLYRERPKLKAVFTSSYSEQTVRSHRIAARYYLQKPCRHGEVLRKVREALNAA